MGEPTPGQIVDNIFLSTQQIFLEATQVGNVGDILVRDLVSNNLWILADAAAITANKQRLGGLMQAQVDFDSTGLAAGALQIAVTATPSFIYGVAGTGGLEPGDMVKLGADGQTFVTANAADLAAGDVVGRYSRKSTDSAGNNSAVATDIVIIKLGVAA